MSVVVHPSSPPPGAVVVGSSTPRPPVQVGFPGARYAVLVDGGERVFTRDTDPGDLARDGDIWLAPQ